MKVKGIECPACGAQIWSRHTHDFRFCPCDYCFVDGGRDYLRSGWGGDGLPDLGPPKTVEIEITETTP